MAIATYKLLIGGEWIETGQTAPVINPWDGKTVAHVHIGGKKEMNRAISAAVTAFKTTRDMPSHKVADVLSKTAQLITQNREKLARAITAEAGKPISYSRQEVDRSAATFSVAAEEASRLGGELLPIDIDPRGDGRYCIVKRFPIGVIGGISPFNFPLNLVAHKVAPAIASRNTIVLKPSSKTPVTALLLGEILEEAGAIPGQCNVVPCSREAGEILATDDRVAKLTFTGSPAVGWRLKGICGRKKITLELGGNAAAIVCADADLGWAVPRIVAGAYGYAGQVCISVQRILVEKKIYDKAVRLLLNEIKKSAKVGDPMRDDVMVGPMIDAVALDKTAAWMKEAVRDGAQILVGGKRRGRCYEPTLVANVTRTMKIVCEEAFAPVAVVTPFSTYRQALDMVNDSVYGLQAGVFTKDIGRAFEAFDKLDVGGVMINDFPTFRADNMPYGGMKMSGFGREGVRCAIEEMTERKVMVIKA
jgi:glyceraldehyde-3-phosphate dehydrogenase (NADP+)